jgi:UDPglucose 6-dehydrogenase
MSTISVVGTGYVGLTTAICLAELGHQVVGVDIDTNKIAALREGELPIYEPGLSEMMANAVEGERLRFTTRYEDAIPEAEFAFIAVATPAARRGDAELAYVRQAARSIASTMQHPLTIINKSTVPIGTANIVTRIVRETLVSDVPFQVVSNPEFLREGSAVNDFMHPDRIVIGANERAAASAVAELYRPLDAPTLITDLFTAEMIKYASNAFLAAKISFINEIARICECVEADVKVVAQGMGMDRRIGNQFLDAGIGYGGSCFPKDVRALARMAESMGYHPELLDAVMQINRDARKLMVDKLQQSLGSLRDQVIGLLGLAFKPNTDDIREAPALDLMTELLQRGAQVRAYDPAAMGRARQQFPAVKYCPDAYTLASGADALLLVTEWDEFRQLDFQRIKGLMRRPVLVDGRNLYHPEAMRELGFVYRGIGRS